MKSPLKHTTVLLAMSLGLAACGGSGSDQQLDTDYSNLRLATSTEGSLQYATNDERLLGALRNGLRLSVASSAQLAAFGGPAAVVGGSGSYSGTTVQVAGVDEADLVKYDGKHVYAVLPQQLPSSPGVSRNRLKIASTNPATAEIQPVSEFALEGEQTSLPLLYQVSSAAGDTEFLAAVTQFYQGWALPQPLNMSLVLLPDRTRVQVVDVRDPLNVSQAWKIELDGWLRGSRKIGNTLYLVSSYRPRLPGLVVPAESNAVRQANERRILGSTAADLLPGYSINGGAEQQLVQPGDCVFPADLSPQDAFIDLLVITAIDLDQRRVADVNCASTNLNGIYVSSDSLYVGGENRFGAETLLTVLHKFALNDGEISYRATGVLGGRIGWTNPSYYMDEYEGDLRIVTSSTAGVHRLSVLRETIDQRLAIVGALPNTEYPAPLGKPGEQVHSVRFLGERAYVVTARVTDPLYAIDLSNPELPFIAGELEIPGVSTYLQPIGPQGSELLLSVGRELNALGVRTSVKVELFDVSDMTQPRSLGVQMFGKAGSWSEANDDPHAITLLSLPQANSFRVALPINVFDTPAGAAYHWQYSGTHLLQVDGIGTATPQLSFAGVIKTDEPDSSHNYPRLEVPNRSVLHDDSVFVVSGNALIGSLWNQLGTP